MSDSKPKPFNPFYPMLVVAGVIFCVTACAYGVMTVRKLRNPLEENPPQFIQWMDDRGFSLMMWELGGLAVLTFAAMGIDTRTTAQPTRSPQSSAQPTSQPTAPSTNGEPDPIQTPEAGTAGDAAEEPENNT